MSKILIVEDDENTLELLKYIVSSDGHDVAVAADGQKALQMACAIKPHLVLLDIMLPELHGFAVCHKIKTNPDLAETKILILSAKSFPADRRQAADAGADAFLSKPVDPQQLLEKIKSLLTS